VLSHSRLCMSLRDYRRHQYAVTSCGVSTEETPRLFCMNKPPACQKCHCVGKDQERGEHRFSGLRGPNQPESFTGEMFVSSRECSQKDSKCNVQHTAQNRLLPAHFYAGKDGDDFLCSDCHRSLNLASSNLTSPPSSGKSSGSGNGGNRRRSSSFLSSPDVAGTYNRFADNRVRELSVRPGSAVSEALRKMKM
jgi:hypothetical protein